MKNHKKGFHYMCANAFNPLFLKTNDATNSFSMETSFIHFCFFFLMSYTFRASLNMTLHIFFSLLFMNFYDILAWFPVTCSIVFIQYCPLRAQSTSLLAI